MKDNILKILHENGFIISEQFMIAPVCLYVRDLGDNTFQISAEVAEKLEFTDIDDLINKLKFFVDYDVIYFKPYIIENNFIRGVFSKFKEASLDQLQEIIKDINNMYFLNGSNAN